MTKPLLYKNELTALLGEIQDSKILDYGCGSGDFIEILLSGMNRPQLIYAADSSMPKIEEILAKFPEEIRDGLVVPKLCSDPAELISNQKFDKIICHNVLECVEDKLKFINTFEHLLADNGVFILSHQDFDSAIFNSNYKQLTRDLVHYFADYQYDEQGGIDGQMGRKIPGLISQSVFSNKATCKSFRIIDNKFVPGNYSYLLSKMISTIATKSFKEQDLRLWNQDLEEQSKNGQYYFAIDLVAAVIKK